MGFYLAGRLREELDIHSVTVKPFDGFIFLCGGTIKGPDEPLVSARHYVVSKIHVSHQLLANRPVVIAEQMTDLLNDGDFHNLIEFEENIAALCSCIIIFLESPGSIAELGSFSVMPHVSSKLLVFCEQRFDSSEKPSFIFLGPLASLKSSNRDSVQIFPMEAPEGDAFVAKIEMLDECWIDIEEAIDASLRRPVSESLLDPMSVSHQMLLMVGLIGLCVALTSSELEECLEMFSVKLSSRHLRRMLRMLVQFKLIVRWSYSSQDFYLSLVDAPLFIFRQRAPNRSIFDQIRFKVDAGVYYSEKDKKKSRAIKMYRKKAAQR